MDKIKLNRQSADEIAAKIAAGDIDLEKHFENVDIQASLPYVLALCKNIEYRKDGTRVGDIVVPEQIREITGKDSNGVVHLKYNHIYKLVEGKYPKEDIQYLLDQFASKLGAIMKTWGFDLLDKLKLKIEQ